MKIKIHRGTKEIGGSCIELAEGNDRIVIDMGLPLEGINKPRQDEKAALPDIRGLYPGDKSKNRVRGLFISHAHLDHYGLMRHSDKKVPVFAGAAARELIDISLAMSGESLTTDSFSPLENGKPVECGAFTVTPVLVDHSAFDAYAFLVEAGGKRLFYSGDFRSHGRKGRLVEEIIRNGLHSLKNPHYPPLSKGESLHSPFPKGRAGEGFASLSSDTSPAFSTSGLKRLAPAAPRPPLDALVLEGTNLASKKNAESEEQLKDNLARFLKRKKKGLTFVMTSSQNLDRLVSIYKATRAAGKTLVVDSYTAFILNAISKYARIPDFSGGFSAIRVFFPGNITSKLIELGHWNKILHFRKFKMTREEISGRRDEIVMVVRPSMRSFIEKMDCLEGNSVVWSMWEGYIQDEKTAGFLDFLQSKGMNPSPLEERIEEGCNTHPALPRKGGVTIFHTSGHADLDTLKKLANALDPKTIIPIHTMTPEKYADIFPRVKQLNDGEEYEV